MVKESAAIPIQNSLQHLSITEPSFENLPPELIENVVAEVLRLTPEGPPSDLLNLLVLSKTIYSALIQDGFYSDLFKERFDWKSVERRWRTMREIEDKREKRMLLEEVSSVRATDELVLNPAGSFTRSHSPNSDYITTSSSPWRKLTSKDLAIEFKRRYTVMSRMRTAALSGAIPASSSQPNTPRNGSPRMNAMTPTGPFKMSIAEPDELTQNLWTVYLMLLENGQLIFDLSLSIATDDFTSSL